MRVWTGKRTGISNLRGRFHSRRVCDFTVLTIATQSQFSAVAIWKENEVKSNLIQMVHCIAFLAEPLADVAFLRLDRAMATVETAQSLLEKGRHSITRKGVGVITMVIVVTC